MSKLSTIINDNIPNIHPGEILLEEFMKPMKITAYKLAKDTCMQQTRVSQIIHCKRSITADTAIRLSKYFGTTPEFWMNLQNMYDLEEQIKYNSDHYVNIQPVSQSISPANT